MKDRHPQLGSAWRERTAAPWPAGHRLMLYVGDRLHRCQCGFRPTAALQDAGREVTAQALDDVMTAHRRSAWMRNRPPGHPNR